VKLDQISLLTIHPGVIERRGQRTSNLMIIGTLTHQDQQTKLFHGHIRTSSLMILGTLTHQDLQSKPFFRHIRIFEASLFFSSSKHMSSHAPMIYALSPYDSYKEPENFNSQCFKKMCSPVKFKLTLSHTKSLRTFIYHLSACKTSLQNSSVLDHKRCNLLYSIN
jgi:hypothetical protein